MLNYAMRRLLTTVLASAIRYEGDHSLPDQWATCAGCRVERPVVDPLPRFNVSSAVHKPPAIARCYRPSTVIYDQRRGKLAVLDGEKAFVNREAERRELPLSGRSSLPFASIDVALSIANGQPN